MNTGGVGFFLLCSNGLCSSLAAIALPLMVMALTETCQSTPINTFGSDHLFNDICFMQKTNTTTKKKKHYIKQGGHNNDNDKNGNNNKIGKVCFFLFVIPAVTLMTMICLLLFSDSSLW